MNGRERTNFWRVFEYFQNIPVLRTWQENLDYVVIGFSLPWTSMISGKSAPLLAIYVVMKKIYNNPDSYDFF